MDGYYDEEYRITFDSNHDHSNRSIAAAATRDESRQIWLTWEDLNYLSAQNRGIWGLSPPRNFKPLLKDCWGSTSPGEFVVVVGEVKSGKSLLLNILAGHVEVSRGDQLTGRVMVNGQERDENWYRLCGNVRQTQEELHGLLTVEEQLSFRANLSLPSDWDPVRRKMVIEEILMVLELTDLRKDAVRKLNCADRRKLLIALAMIGLPQVLILDEPTNGLGSSEDLEMMKIIHKFTRRRQITTIISAKHIRQAAFPFIDRIIILSGGGVVYSGSIAEAVPYFQQFLDVDFPEYGENPVTCMLDAVNCRDCRQNPAHLDRIHQIWFNYAMDNQLYRPNVPLLPQYPQEKFQWHRGLLYELKEQLRRSWLLLIRNHVYWIGQTFLALILALVVAFSAFRLDDSLSAVSARLNVLYYTAVFFQFFPFIPFLFVCYRDKWVLQRERRHRVCRTGPNYLSVWCVIYGFRMLLVTLYSVIVYFIVGLRLPFNYFLVFWLALLAEAWVSMGMGYLLVTLVAKVAITETLASFILLVCIWFSGDFAFNPTCTWILRWIAYLSPIFYTYNALINNEFKGTVFQKSQTMGNILLKQRGYLNYGTWASIGTLLGFGLLYMILGFVALHLSSLPRTKKL